MNEEFAQSVIMAQTGNTKALHNILKYTEKQVYSFLYFMAKTECEIQDIVQEVLLKVAGNIKSLKDPHLFKSWLNKIVIRKYYDHLRKRNKKCEKISDKDVETSEAESEFKDYREPIEDCINCELAGVIKKSVCKLNEPYRLALIMREFEGMSYDEIAKITNVNIGTVKSRIARARSRMKDLIKPYMEQN